MLDGGMGSVGVVDYPETDLEESTMSHHIEYLKYRHPRTYAVLEKSVIRDAGELAARMVRLKQVRGHSDFDDAQRGAVYRARQLAVPRSREYGDRKIFELLERELAGFNFKQIGVDIVGGNGTTARNAAALLAFPNSPYIISADPCLDMVNETLSRNLPAVWQSAQETLFANDSFDFVVGSRGFHHIPEDMRAAAFDEARRILRPGGVFLVVDFEEESPTARWYSEGLHTYTTTGHKYKHFYRSELMLLLANSGFRSCSVFEIYDPFKFWANSAEDARNTLLEHVVSMFGMVKLQRTGDETERDYWARVTTTIAPWCTFAANQVAFEPRAVPRLSVFQESDGRWCAEMPRIALCAIGIKG